MPKIKFRSSESEGWQPLPKGDYLIQFDEVEETTSSNDNPQLKVSGHVMEGEYADKKVTIFLPIMENTGWRHEEICDAAGVDYEKVPTGDLDSDGKPIYDYEYDPDDLVGASALFEVSLRKYKGKNQNDFKNPRDPNAEEGGESDEGEEAEEEEAEEQEERKEQAEAAPEPEKPSNKPAAAAKGGTRRRRVRG